LFLIFSSGPKTAWS